MQTKPEPTSKIAITVENPENYLIIFYATPEIIEEARSFGELHNNGTTGNYILYVNALYDFQEVLEYLKSLAH